MCERGRDGGISKLSCRAGKLAQSYGAIIARGNCGHEAADVKLNVREKLDTADAQRMITAQRLWFNIVMQTAWLGGPVCKWHGIVACLCSVFRGND
jgi:hypothetical protein